MAAPTGDENPVNGIENRVAEIDTFRDSEVAEFNFDPEATAKSLAEIFFFQNSRPNGPANKNAEFQHMSTG